MQALSQLDRNDKNRKEESDMLFRAILSLIVLNFRHLNSNPKYTPIPKRLLISLKRREYTEANIRIRCWTGCR